MHGLLLLCDTSYLCGVPTRNALVEGNGSYILWPLVALTWGYDINHAKNVIIRNERSEKYLLDNVLN